MPRQTSVPLTGVLGCTTFQSHASGIYPAGTQCFAKLSIIIQINLSDPTGVLLITMSGSLPNVLFLRLSLKSQKLKSIFMFSIQAILCIQMSKAEQVRLSAEWTHQHVQLSQWPCHTAQKTPAIKSHPHHHHSSVGPVLAGVSWFLPTIISFHLGQQMLTYICTHLYSSLVESSLRF